MGPGYFGPYKVIKGIGSVAYHLELPPPATIHPVFHVSQLKKALGTAVASQQLLPHLDVSLEWVVEPDQVLEVRQAGKEQEVEVLIKWKDLPISESSWEFAKSISQAFPDFHLEDKVILAAEGNDRPPFGLHTLEETGRIEKQLEDGWRITTFCCRENRMEKLLGNDYK